MDFLLLVVLAIGLVYATMQAKSAKARMVASILQLGFATIVYVFARDLLGTSIHNVAPERTNQFLFMFCLSLSAIVVYGLLGIGNLLLSMLNYASNGHQPKHSAT
jgi:hypothetical protein